MMRAIVADDHPLYREAVRLRLERLFAPAEVGETASLGELLGWRTAGGGAVDLILLDLHMPGMTGSPAIGKVVDAFPGAAVVLMSGLATGAEVTEAIRAGARGYLPKTMAPDHFAAALKLILDGGSYVPADVLASQLESPVAPAPYPRLGDLTPREQQVLVRLAVGAPNKEIGRELGLAEVTVKLHVRQILKKIGARNRSEAASIATRAGMI